MKNKFAIFLFILSIFSGFVWSLGTFSLAPDPGGDGPYYNEIAVNFLHDGRLSYQGEGVNIAPVYPVFISAVYFLFGEDNYLAVRVAQILVFASSVVIFYYLAKKIFGFRTAALSGILMSLAYFYPIAASRFHRETLTVFFIALALFFLYRALVKKKWWRFVIAGIFFGLLILVNSITQLLFVLVAILIFVVFWRKISWQKNLGNCLVFILGTVLIVLPWMFISNSMSDSYALAPREGRLLYNRADVMERLYGDYPAHLLGNTLGYFFVEKIYPSVNIHAVKDGKNTYQREEELYNQGNSVFEVNQIMRDEALKKIISSPHKYFLITLLDFINFNSLMLPSHGLVWSNSPMHSLFAEGRHGELSDFLKGFIIIGFRLAWLIFLILMIYGIIKSKDRWTKTSFFWLVIVYFNLGYSVIHAIPRYALLIYPLYLTFFAYGLLIFVQKSSKIRWIISKIGQ